MIAFSEARDWTEEDTAILNDLAKKHSTQWISLKAEVSDQMQSYQLHISGWPSVANGVMCRIRLRKLLELEVY
jgi:hypothetical protein